eukprot:Unigene1286_Nuclearia_a/m.4103 Unigene1286_Nuclearia_a/g.4103  ORF Unigene1286_Nuclearia_a/g.4103 Unigene1286_Nuclearia_a/m.4103 type:complete len:201 (+) Unigene1286_Nuclearia_a:1846-2448(+)
MTPLSVPLLVLLLATAAAAAVDEGVVAAARTAAGGARGRSVALRVCARLTLRADVGRMRDEVRGRCAQRGAAEADGVCARERVRVRCGWQGLRCDWAASCVLTTRSQSAWPDFHRVNAVWRAPNSTAAAWPADVRQLQVVARKLAQRSRACDGDAAPDLLDRDCTPYVHLTFVSGDYGARNTHTRARARACVCVPRTVIA